MTSASSASVRSSLWFIPVMCVLAGVAVSIGTIGVDRWFDFDAVPRSLTGGPDAATAILETITVSMVSLAALVLTITMVVVRTTTPMPSGSRQIGMSARTLADAAGEK